MSSSLQPASSRASARTASRVGSSCPRAQALLVGGLGEVGHGGGEPCGVEGGGAEGVAEDVVQPFHGPVVLPGVRHEAPATGCYETE